MMGTRVLFLDDFSTSGETLLSCREAVKKFGATIVGQYHYAWKGQLIWTDEFFDETELWS